MSQGLAPLWPPVCQARGWPEPAGRPLTLPQTPEPSRGLPVSGGRRTGGSDPAPRPPGPCSAREPSAKRSVRTSGWLCAGPGRPPCAALRCCLLPPFCCGDPHPLPPDGEGDRLPLDRWLPVFLPSSRRLGLSLAGGGGRRMGEPAWDGPSASDRGSPSFTASTSCSECGAPRGALPPGRH